MSKKLKNFVFPKKGVSKYPWDQWLDGSVWELTKGKDFEVTDSHMRGAAYSAAKVRGKKVRTHLVDGKVIIMAFEE